MNKDNSVILPNTIDPFAIQCETAYFSGGGSDEMQTNIHTNCWTYSDGERYSASLTYPRFVDQAPRQLVVNVYGGKQLSNIFPDSFIPTDWVPAIAALYPVDYPKHLDCYDTFEAVFDIDETELSRRVEQNPGSRLAEFARRIRQVRPYYVIADMEISSSRLKTVEHGYMLRPAGRQENFRYSAYALDFDTLRVLTSASYGESKKQT